MTAARLSCFTFGVEWVLLTTLSPAERRELTTAARPRSFARHEVICHEGDPADSLHLVAAGRLSVRVSLASGDSAMINVLKAGDFFGELALLRHNRRRTATITALEPSRTLVLSATSFRRICERRPAVERALGVVLADRVDELSKRLLEVMYVGLDRRVFRRVHELAESYRAPDGAMVIPLTQAQIADMTGGTRPSVNQALQRLVDERIVELHRGRIEVLDLERLRRHAGE